MPLRTTPLVPGEYYHVYNRGVAYQPIYNNKRDYERFLLCLNYYRYNNVPLRLSRFLQLPKDDSEVLMKHLEDKNDKIVDIISFCLMPNHFHLLVRQNTNNGISRFLRLSINSYARYFNVKHERVGAVFQGMFKVVHITTEEQLIHVSRYIHLNPLVSYVVKDKDFLSYPYSSLHSYLKGNLRLIVDPNPILEHFSSPEEYLKFVLDQADYGKELEKIKHLVLE